MIILKNTDKNIKYILQISDIHIRLTKRHDEYRIIFEKLYEKLESLNKDECVLVICGDLFHNKSDLSPECISVASDFLKNCTDRMDTILIAGNHDATLSNKNRLDSISPIVDSLKIENLFYLKKSGTFQYENILFNNFGIFDDADSYVRFEDINKKEKILTDHYVCLYHGPVDNAITDIGYKINNKIISSKLFEGHDIALLGDIHKFQTVSNHCITVNENELDMYDLNEWEIVNEFEE